MEAGRLLTSDVWDGPLESLELRNRGLQSFALPMAPKTETGRPFFEDLDG